MSSSTWFPSRVTRCLSEDYKKRWGCEDGSVRRAVGGEGWEEGGVLFFFHRYP